MKPHQFLEEQQQLKCPRCDSANTKFCYYNNYNLSQPRHYCKNCRRYWTKGGSLRNIPVGGGTRNKNTKRRPNSSSSSTPKRSSNSETSVHQNPKQETFSAANSVSAPMSEFNHNQHHSVIGINGSFGSISEANGRSSIMSEGMNSNGPSLGSLQMDDFESNQNIVVRNRESVEFERSNNLGWPDLAIYAPGSFL